MTASKNNWSNAFSSYFLAHQLAASHLIVM